MRCGVRGVFVLEGVVAEAAVEDATTRLPKGPDAKPDAISWDNDRMVGGW